MDDLYKANPAYNTGVRRTREKERERERGRKAAPTLAMEMAATCSHLLIGRAAKPSVYVRAYFPLAAPATHPACIGQVL